MLLSLVIPVYNEAEHLGDFLELIDAAEFPISKELVIVDDCSSDRSFEILNSFSFSSKVALLRHDINRGKTAALRTGIEKASGDIVGIQDADFEYDPKDIPSLIEPIISGRADVCFGSRYKSSQQVHRTFHFLVNKLLTTLSNVFSGIYLSDMETCYKFFRADLIKNLKLKSMRFGFEPEVTAKVARLKARVVELPVSYFPRNYIEGKKITWRDGVAALWHIFYFNLLESSKDKFKDTMPPSYLSRPSSFL